MDAGLPNAFTMSFFGLKQRIIFIGSTSYEWGRRRWGDEDDDEDDDRRGVSIKPSFPKVHIK
jgi:hypothetical protein